MKYTAEGLQKARETRMRKKSVCLRFFAPLPGLRVSASNSSVGTLENFCRAEGPAKCLLGAPKPAELLDKVSRSPGASACCLRPGAIAPGPYFHARPYGRAGDRYLP